MGLLMGQNIHLPFYINETDTLAGTTAELVAPADGFITDFQVIVQKAVTTGGTVKVQTDASVDVAGATVTVADAATKGTVYSAVATKTSSTRKVTKGDRIQIVPAAAFATAGAVSGVLTINTGG